MFTRLRYIWFQKKCSQYFVFLPSASIHALQRSGKDSIRSWKYVSVISFHFSCTLFTNCCLFVGRGGRKTDSCSNAQTFSIGFRSGEFPGQSVQTLVNFSAILFIDALAVWGLAPSCMRILRCGLGNAEISFITFEYKIILTFIWLKEHTHTVYHVLTVMRGIAQPH